MKNNLVWAMRKRSRVFLLSGKKTILLCLGTNDDIVADWKSGVFKDNFRGVWGSLDGSL